MKNELRSGYFTSSEIVALTSEGRAAGSTGKPFDTYIEETNMERAFGLPLELEADAKPLSWGNLLESRVHELLGLEYQLSSKETFIHPHIDYWRGSPDGHKFDDGKTVTDIKCPITRKSFYNLVSSGDVDKIRETKDGEKYYWQLVSNGIITGCKYAELIVYMPYESELEAIREMARNYDGANQHRFMWIGYDNSVLPFIKDGGKFKNINTIRFEISQRDKEFLIGRVMLAGKQLIPF